MKAENFGRVKEIVEAALIHADLATMSKLGKALLIEAKNRVYTPESRQELEEEIAKTKAIIEEIAKEIVQGIMGRIPDLQGLNKDLARLNDRKEEMINAKRILTDEEEEELSALLEFTPSEKGQGKTRSNYGEYFEIPELKKGDLTPQYRPTGGISHYAIKKADLAKIEHYNLNLYGNLARFGQVKFDGDKVLMAVYPA